MDPATLIEARRQPAARTLRLAWSDGFAVDLPYDRLRGWCPCAACQGHEVRELSYHPPARPVAAIEAIEPVGNYALSFLFSDGHGTGIYRHDLLRGLGEHEAVERQGDPR